MGAVAVILIAKIGYPAASVRHDRRMHTKIFIDTDHGSWDSAEGNMEAALDSVLNRDVQNGFGKRTA